MWGSELINRSLYPKIPGISDEFKPDAPCWCPCPQVCFHLLILVFIVTIQCCLEYIFKSQVPTKIPKCRGNVLNRWPNLNHAGIVLVFCQCGYKYWYYLTPMDSSYAISVSWQVNLELTSFSIYEIKNKVISYLSVVSALAQLNHWFRFHIFHIHSGMKNLTRFHVMGFRSNQYHSLLVKFFDVRVRSDSSSWWSWSVFSC